VLLNFELAMNVHCLLVKDYSSLSLQYPLPSSGRPLLLDEFDEKNIFPGDLVQEVINRIEKAYGYFVETVVTGSGQAVDA
jgi:hypothetical protein